MRGTTSGEVGTNGDDVAARRRLGWLGASAVALLIAAVNAGSAVHDLAGAPVDAWEPWVWEFTSAAFWIALLPMLWRVAGALQPPRLKWRLTVAAWVGLTVPISAAHLAWLAASRPAIYAAVGSHYTPNWSATQIGYEYRKDLLVTLMLIGVGLLVDLWAAAATPRAAGPAAVQPYRFEVRDGARTSWFDINEIERIEAAGNYVELHTARGPVLHRATLTAVEAELTAHGFVRIHRSRLIRRAAVTSVAGTASGDFQATLTSGVRVAGSRRFRDVLAQAAMTAIR